MNVKQYFFCSMKEKDVIAISCLWLEIPKNKRAAAGESISKLLSS